MTEHSAIKKLLYTISSLQEETWNELIDISELRTAKKKQNIAKTGELFNYEVFLVKGVLRCFHVTSDAKEYTTSFYSEGNFLSPAFSRQSKGRSSLNIQALENCEMLFFEEKKFTDLRYKFSDLFLLASRISEKELILKSMKEVLLATGNLKSLYHFFQKNFPGLENRISQRYVASYIGSDPVSLSRIRAQLLKGGGLQTKTSDIA